MQCGGQSNRNDVHSAGMRERCRIGLVFWPTSGTNVGNIIVSDGRGFVGMVGPPQCAGTAEADGGSAADFSCSQRSEMASWCVGTPLGVGDRSDCHRREVQWIRFCGRRSGRPAGD